MQYILTIVLTLILFCSIIVIIGKYNKKKYSKKIYRQSDMHNMLKKFFYIDINKNILNSQSKKRKKKKNVKVFVLNKKAYWVIDNVFYVGETVDGKVQPDTGNPVDIMNMSKEKVEQMLFILDSLKNGNKNDSSSAGDE
jgi:archaellin